MSQNRKKKKIVNFELYLLLLFTKKEGENGSRIHSIEESAT